MRRVTRIRRAVSTIASAGLVLTGLYVGASPATAAQTFTTRITNVEPPSSAVTIHSGLTTTIKVAVDLCSVSLTCSAPVAFLDPVTQLVPIPTDTTNVVVVSSANPGVNIPVILESAAAVNGAGVAAPGAQAIATFTTPSLTATTQFTFRIGGGGNPSVLWRAFLDSTNPGAMTSSRASGATAIVTVNVQNAWITPSDLTIPNMTVDEQYSQSFDLGTFTTGFDPSTTQLSVLSGAPAGVTVSATAGAPGNYPSLTFVGTPTLADNNGMLSIQVSDGAERSDTAQLSYIVQAAPEPTFCELHPTEYGCPDYVEPPFTPGTVSAPPAQHWWLATDIPTLRVDAATYTDGFDWSDGGQITVTSLPRGLTFTRDNAGYGDGGTWSESGTAPQAHITGAPAVTTDGSFNVTFTDKFESQSVTVTYTLTNLDWVNTNSSEYDWDAPVVISWNCSGTIAATKAVLFTNTTHEVVTSYDLPGTRAGTITVPSADFASFSNIYQPNDFIVRTYYASQLDETNLPSWADPYSGETSFGRLAKTIMIQTPQTQLRPGDQGTDLTYYGPSGYLIVAYRDGVAIDQFTKADGATWHVDFADFGLADKPHHVEFQVFDLPADATPPAFESGTELTSSTNIWLIPDSVLSTITFDSMQVGVDFTQSIDLAEHSIGFDWSSGGTATLEPLPSGLHYEIENASSPGGTRSPGGQAPVIHIFGSPTVAGDFTATLTAADGNFGSASTDIAGTVAEETTPGLALSVNPVSHADGSTSVGVTGPDEMVLCAYIAVSLDPQRCDYVNGGQSIEYTYNDIMTWYANYDANLPFADEQVTFHLWTPLLAAELGVSPAPFGPQLDVQSSNTISATLTAAPPAQIVDLALPEFRVGDEVHLRFEMAQFTTGFNWARGGDCDIDASSLPAGLTVDRSTSSTGTPILHIDGRPTETSSGSTHFEVFDDFYSDVETSLEWTVTQPVTLTNEPTTIGVGQSSTFTFTGPDTEFGVFFVDGMYAGGDVVGNLLAYDPATGTFTVDYEMYGGFAEHTLTMKMYSSDPTTDQYFSFETRSDASASVTFTPMVDDSSMTPLTLAAAVVNEPYSKDCNLSEYTDGFDFANGGQVKVTGLPDTITASIGNPGTDTAWSADGQAPVLTLTGTPTVVDSYLLTITTTDLIGHSASTSAWLIVGAHITLDAPTLKPMQVNTEYDRSFNVADLSSGYNWSYGAYAELSGLPAGMFSEFVNIDPDNEGRSAPGEAPIIRVYGTPEAEITGSLNLAVEDNWGNKRSVDFAFTVLPESTISVTPTSISSGESSHVTWQSPFTDTLAVAYLDGQAVGNWVLDEETSSFDVAYDTFDSYGNPYLYRSLELHLFTEGQWELGEPLPAVGDKRDASTVVTLTARPATLSPPELPAAWAGVSYDKSFDVATLNPEGFDWTLGGTVDIADLPAGLHFEIVNAWVDDPTRSDDGEAPVVRIFGTSTESGTFTPSLHVEDGNGTYGATNFTFDSKPVTASFQPTELHMGKVGTFAYDGPDGLSLCFYFPQLSQDPFGCNRVDNAVGDLPYEIGPMWAKGPLSTPLLMTARVFPVFDAEAPTDFAPSLTDDSYLATTDVTFAETPQLMLPTLPDAKVGVPYARTIDLGDGYSQFFDWSEGGTAELTELPAGLNYEVSNALPGSHDTAPGQAPSIRISGTPSAPTDGPMSFTLTATAHAGGSASADGTVTVLPGSTVDAPAIGTLKRDAWFNETFDATTLNATGFDWSQGSGISIVGLPTGLRADSIAVPSGTAPRIRVWGQPLELGTATARLTVTDDFGDSAITTFDVIVKPWLDQTTSVVYPGEWESDYYTWHGDDNQTYAVFVDGTFKEAGRVDSNTTFQIAWSKYGDQNMDHTVVVRVFDYLYDAENAPPTFEAPSIDSVDATFLVKPSITSNPDFGGLKVGDPVDMYVVAADHTRFYNWEWGGALYFKNLPAGLTSTTDNAWAPGESPVAHITGVLTDAATTSVTMTIEDHDWGDDTSTFDVTVAATAPTATLEPSAQSVSVGQTATLVYTGPRDRAVGLFDSEGQLVRHGNEDMLDKLQWQSFGRTNDITLTVRVYAAVWSGIAPSFGDEVIAEGTVTFLGNTPTVTGLALGKVQVGQDYNKTFDLAEFTAGFDWSVYGGYATIEDLPAGLNYEVTNVADPPWTTPGSAPVVRIFGNPEKAGSYTATLHVFDCVYGEGGQSATATLEGNVSPEFKLTITPNPVDPHGTMTLDWGTPQTVSRLVGFVNGQVVYNVSVPPDDTTMLLAWADVNGDRYTTRNVTFRMYTTAQMVPSYTIATPFTLTAEATLNPWPTTLSPSELLVAFGDSASFFYAGSTNRQVAFFNAANEIVWSGNESLLTNIPWSRMGGTSDVSFTVRVYPFEQGSQSPTHDTEFAAEAIVTFAGNTPVVSPLKFGAMRVGTAYDKTFDLAEFTAGFDWSVNGGRVTISGLPVGLDHEVTNVADGDWTAPGEAPIVHIFGTPEIAGGYESVLTVYDSVYGASGQSASTYPGGTVAVAITLSPSSVDLSFGQPLDVTYAGPSDRLAVVFDGDTVVNWTSAEMISSDFTYLGLAAYLDGAAHDHTFSLRVFDLTYLGGLPADLPAPVATSTINFKSHVLTLEPLDFGRVQVGVPYDKSFILADLSTGFDWINGGRAAVEGLPTGLHYRISNEVEPGSGLSTSAPVLQVFGTPSASGAFTPTVTLADSSFGKGGQHTTVGTTVTVVPGATLAVLPLNHMVRGKAFTQTFDLANYSANFDWTTGGSVDVSELPDGLTSEMSNPNVKGAIFSQDGEAPQLVISGTPTVSGDFTVTVTLTDRVGGSASVDVPLVIAAGQVPTDPAAQTKSAGGTATFAIPGLTDGAVITPGSKSGGVQSVTVVDRDVQVRVLSNFSGLITQPITVSQDGSDTVVHLVVRVYPTSTKNNTFTLKKQTTYVHWSASPNAHAYKVIVNGHVDCTTPAKVTSCTVKGLLGPKAAISIVVVGGSNFTSRTSAKYVKSSVVAPFGSVLFAADSSRLTTAGKAAIHKYAVAIARQGFTTVTVAGYISHWQNNTSAADKAHGIVLSKARAASVRAYLASEFKKLGVNVSVKTLGNGGSHPTVSSTLSSSAAGNRRADISVS